jgi:hypothetical protein
MKKVTIEECWRDPFLTLTSRFLSVVFNSEEEPTFYPTLPFFQLYNEIDIRNMQDANDYLMGIILTDTYYTLGGGMEIYQSEKKALDKILKCLDMAKIKYKDKKIKNTVHHRIYIDKEQSSNTFKVIIEDRKNPPFTFLCLNENEKLRILDGLMDGDGTWNPGENSGSFYKPSLLDWIQPFLFTLGYRTTVRKDRIIFGRIMEQNCITIGTKFVEMPGEGRMYTIDINGSERPILRHEGKIFTFSL